MAIVKPMKRFERVTWTKKARREREKRAKKVPLAARDGRSGVKACGQHLAIYSDRFVRQVGHSGTGSGLGSIASLWYHEDAIEE